MKRALLSGSDGVLDESRRRSRLLTFALSLSLFVTACGADSAPAPGESSTVRKDAGKGNGKSADDSTARRDAGSKKDAGKAVQPADTETETDGDDAGAKAASASGLPCAVSALFAEHCASCHGATPLFGAPMSLVSHADLLMPAPLHPEQKTFEAVQERVHDDVSPMPPAPKTRLTAAELATLDAWVEAGAPESTTECEPSVPGGADAGAGTGSGVPKPDDCEQTYELNAHGGSTPTDHSKFNISASPALEGNQYHCFYFDPPYDSAAGLLWFQPMLDNTANLHHWILYATDNKTHESGTSAGCNAQEAGAYFVAGWAPGANNSVVPDDVALDLPSGPKAGLILEVHYYNNTGKAQQDASGIRFCTGAKAKRAHLAAVHTLGTEGLCIPAGASKDFSATCSPRTDMGDIHINGIWPHMHKSARRMVVSIKRKGGTTDVIHDAPFDFQSQVFFPMKDDVVVHPGDSVLTRCYYENDTSSQIHYGERTQDEMCYAFTMSWPAGALANPPTMLSDPSTALLNRCADSLSILQSCNGLADRPVNAEHP